MSELSPYEEKLAIELGKARAIIEALTEQLEAARADAKEAEAYAEELKATMDDTAWAVWTQFKGWEGERKFALREVVKWLKGDKSD